MSRPVSEAEADILAWECSARLLAYPEVGFMEELELLRKIAGTLPAQYRSALMDTILELLSHELSEIQESYVATFDVRRRCSLYLTYFLYGDTRKRGAALLRFRQAYLQAGYQLDDSELPDHLSVVLEYGAAVDAQKARELLIEHRAGIEVLRLALLDMRSPWAGAVAAISATLPVLQGDDFDTIHKLAYEGPPDEEVGLSGYDGSAFDPVLAKPSPTLVDLPMPTVQGAR